MRSFALSSSTVLALSTALAVSTMLALLMVSGGCGAEAAPALGTDAAQPLVLSLGMDNRPVQLGGAPATAPIRLHVASSSADTSYRTTWTLTAGACLRVVPRTGEPVVIAGSPIVADYYHVGRVLGVAVGPAAGSQELFAYGDPVSWQTGGCAAPAPAAPE